MSDEVRCAVLKAIGLTAKVYKIFDEEWIITSRVRIF